MLSLNCQTKLFLSFIMTQSGEGNEEALKICTTLEIKDLCRKFQLQTGTRTIYGIIKVNRKSYVQNLNTFSNHCSLLCRFKLHSEVLFSIRIDSLKELR